MDIMNQNAHAHYFWALFWLPSLHCRCDCYRQALMTARHTCPWFGAESFLLNTDVASASGAGASLLGSVNAGLRLKTKKMERTVNENDDKVFCTCANQGGLKKIQKGRDKTCVFLFFFYLNLQPHQLGQTVWSHFSVTEMASMPSWRWYDDTCDISDAHCEAASWNTSDPGCDRVNHSGLWNLSSLFVFIPLLKTQLGERVCLCVRLHFKVLLCLHTCACEFFFFVYVCVVVMLPTFTTLRSGVAWTLLSDWPLTFLKCCSVAAQECLNVKTTRPAFLFPSSCVSCVIEYCYWTEHSWTLDSYTSAPGYRFGSRSVMTCSWVKMGQAERWQKN